MPTHSYSAKRGTSTIDRILANITIDPEKGCWLWQGATVKGYGRIRTATNEGLGGQKVMTHRATYEHYIGPIPDTLMMDHLCRTPLCCNPRHVVPVTAVGNGRTSWHAIKTHCKNGHPLSGDNLYARKGHPQWRQCATCAREAVAKYQAKL